MTSSMRFSKMARKARAPVLSSMALTAMARTASRVNRSCTPSMANSFEYCLTMAFFVRSRMRTRSDSVSGSSTDTTGRRPTNSGIMP